MHHLTKLGFGKPTKIQELAIPTLITGQDAIIISRTGSGKTLAYLIPLINKLNHHSNVAGVRGLIMAPTRELALQIATVLKRLVTYQDHQLRVCLCTGGDSLEQQFQALSLNPDVIVATPGRIEYHLQQIHTLQGQFKTIQYVVVDECDQMFEQQLLPQIQEVLSYVNSPQIVLTSATLPQQLQDFSAAKLKRPKMIQNEIESFPEELFIQNILVSKEFKIQALYQTVMQILHDEKENAAENAHTKILIFVATKYHCEYISELFKELGISCEAIYGTLDQSARNLLVSKFQTGAFNVLFATDVAARGVDIQNLNYVINFNFPFSSRMYLHRGGRCARNG